MFATNIGSHGQLGVARQQVVGLSEHRDRRHQRFRLAKALRSGDPIRSALVRHLRELIDLTAADRAAAVWIDEYGAPLVHTHLTLDLLCDVPRRTFPVEPLERAWEIGLPGAYDAARDGRGRGSASNLLALALGSDGARAWFVVTDSMGPRGKLNTEARQKLLFVAGECAAVLLHRDLDEGGMQVTPPWNTGVKRFAGWAILEDLEGRDASTDEVATIEQRFLIGRIVRDLVDEDLMLPGIELAERVNVCREEIALRSRKGGEPASVWNPVLDALGDEIGPGLVEQLLEVGERAESLGHRHGALELYRCAFEIAAALHAPALAVDAARFQGRVHRRFARWDESVRSYRVAQEVSAAADLHERAARVLVGLASVRQENGNLPGARNGYMEAMEAARRSGDRDVLATVHHGLLALEHAAGNVEEALEQGWIAVATYEDDRGRLRCLAGLAGALVDFGDRAAAEDAWTVVAEQSDESYYRIYAHDALAYLAALRRDLPEFERQARLCDTLDWESGPVSARGEVLYYRGLSYAALGMHDAASRWLGRSVAFAEEHGLNRTLFRAEEALGRLERDRAERREAERLEAEKAMPAAPREVREGLRAMRQALAGVA